MSMPIQRQSEQFSAFDTGTRWARDRSSTDLPRGLAGLINSIGPRIQAGLLNTRTAGDKIQPGPWTGEDWERAENHDPTDEYRDHPDGWSHQPTEQDYADWEARHNRTAAGHDFGEGPRDHGGHGPDGGPSVPDWYYDDDDDDDGDPEDPPGTPTENPWDRQASRHPFDLAAAARLAGEGHFWHPSGLGGGNREAPTEHVFDWYDDSVGQEETDGVDHMTPEEFNAFTNHVWRADLENGHFLHIQEDDPSLTGSGKREYFPTISHPGDPTGNLRHPNRPDEPSYETGLGKWFKSRAKAQRAIERAYMEKYPVGGPGAPRPSRDSGVDYESLVNPKTDLGDEDFGHIFGSRRTAALDMADMIRLAGDGMSYEDTMAHIDDVLSGGEGHKMHDVPGVDRSLMRDHLSEGFDADGYCPDCERTFVEGHEPGFLCNEQNEDTPRTWNASRHTAAGEAVDPAAQQQMMVPDGGGYQPGHRVGLPWRDTVIPGTVIGVDGPQVVIRWDEGQYSNEEPRNIQLL